jgi:hypothetical protein
MRGGNGERKASERSSSEDDSWLADINLAERISQSPLVQWIQWDSVRNAAGMAGIVVKELLFFIRQKYKRSFTRAQYDVPVFL